MVLHLEVISCQILVLVFRDVWEWNFYTFSLPQSLNIKITGQIEDKVCISKISSTSWTWTRANWSSLEIFNSLKLSKNKTTENNHVCTLTQTLKFSSDSDKDPCMWSEVFCDFPHLSHTEYSNRDALLLMRSQISRNVWNNSRWSENVNFNIMCL